MECGVASLTGLLIGLLELYSEHHDNLARGHDLLSGLLAGALAILCHSYIAHINVLGACLSGIVWCLPGLRITMAMLDLSTGNPVTGTAKFMSSLITAMNLGIGVVAGMSLGHLTGVEPDQAILDASDHGPVPQWFLPVCIVMSTFPTMVLLDARPSHFIQYTFGSALAYYLSSYATIYIGQAFGSWLAAAAVGIISNLYGRFTPHPAIELSLFSILMLVPGSIGVRSVLASDSLSTVSFLTQMITGQRNNKPALGTTPLHSALCIALLARISLQFVCCDVCSSVLCLCLRLVAIAIVTGLFTANIVIPPLRAL